MLEYMGRNDNQVKIRGFRIELGEIEAQVLRHEKVREAAVVVREDAAGDRCLVAYLSLNFGALKDAASIRSIRALLKSALPEYMVPSAFVFMERLPRTPNGKLDRQALPPPDLEAYSSRIYEAPSGSIETALARMWAQILNIQRVGRRDNFFELGGHSLHLMRISAEVTKCFDVGLPVAAIFQAPTVSELAELIESIRATTSASPGADTRECEEGVI